MTFPIFQVAYSCWWDEGGCQNVGLSQNLWTFFTFLEIASKKLLKKISLFRKIGFPDIVWSGARKPWPSRDQKNTKKNIVFELRVYLFCVYSFIAGNRTEKVKIYIHQKWCNIPIQEHWKDQREKTNHALWARALGFRELKTRWIWKRTEGPEKIQRCFRVFPNRCPPSPALKSYFRPIQKAFSNLFGIINKWSDMTSDGMGWDGMVIIGQRSSHTWYLSFFLHGQNFWRIKFTPNKPIYYDKIHSKLPIFCVITAKYTVNCQFFALNL